MRHLRKAIVHETLWVLLGVGIVIAITFENIFLFAKVSLLILSVTVLAGFLGYLWWSYRKIQRLMQLPSKSVWGIFEFHHLGETTVTYAYISFRHIDISLAEIEG